MEIRTYYFPCNQIGRGLIKFLLTHINCSANQIYKVADNIAVSVTITKPEIVKIERILQIYDLI